MIERLLKNRETERQQGLAARRNRRSRGHRAAPYLGFRPIATADAGRAPVELSTPWGRFEVGEHRAPLGQHWNVDTRRHVNHLRPRGSLSVLRGDIAGRVRDDVLSPAHAKSVDWCDLNGES